jgi:hypothetical protein
MTGRLGRVHALLAAGNVPCEMKRLPDGRPVLAAGIPSSSRWDVLIWDVDGQLMVHHRGAIDRLPAGGTDQAVADAIKFRVVESWADQGDPEAKALLAAIGPRYRENQRPAGARESAARGYPRPSRPTEQPVRRVTAQMSPWGFAIRVTDSAPGDGVPTSWEWGMAPSTVADYYQRFFGAMRSAVIAATTDEPR